MPKVAAELKAEIRRLAKREIEAEVGQTKQAVVRYRHEIALLKRELREQGKKIALLRGKKQERLGRVRAAAEDVITMTPEDQLKFWNALNETPKLTPAQRRLGSMMRERS
ncbi:MAG: hypothetical protein ABR915_14720 [Thermoguttaceae bacterium]|jgi:hypothetical protein